MSLHHDTNEAAIARGWVRALLLFLVYVTLSVVVGLLVSLSSTATDKPLAPEASSIWLISASVLSIAAVFAFRKYVDRRSFMSIGLSPAALYPQGLAGFLLGMFLICAGALAIYFLGGLQWTSVAFNADIFSGLLLMLLVAASEELVFRGYILRNLMKSFNENLSLLISAMLFALVHVMNPGVPVIGIVNIILGGLLLGLIFLRTRNIWMPVLFHFSWNFVQGPVLGLAVSGLAFKPLFTVSVTGTALLTGGAFGFEGSLVCTVLLLAAVAALMFNKRLAYDRLQG